jgi:prolycopene isomerase
MAEENTYDTIIIGAGLGGLTTGNFLAKAGQKALVLEKHFQAGGCVTTYRRGGYPMDTVHVLGGLKEGSALDRVFKYLNLYSKVQFNEVQKLFIYKFPGYDINCYADIGKFKTELQSHFPDQKANIDGILGEMQKVWKEIRASLYAPSWLELLTFPLRFPRLLRYQNRTFEEFLNRFTGDYKLKKILSAGWGYNGLPMDEVSALYMAGMLMSYHEGGAWYPRGGYQNLSDALARNLREYGGVIKLSTEVEKIIFRKKRAVGVRTKEGEEFFARRIVSNADTKNTFLDLIDRDIVPDKLYRRVKGYKQSTSGVLVHLVVDMSIPQRLSCGCIMYFPDFDTERHQFRLWRKGAMETDPDIMGLGLSVATLKDKDMVPDGKHVLDLIYMPPAYEYFKKDQRQKYLALKEDFSEKMIKAAEHIIPGLGSHIVLKDVSTPLTFERYTGARGGAWYDIDCSPRQALMGRIRNKTPIKGLYLTGAKTFPGSGMFAAIQAGLFTADSILGGGLSAGRYLLKP